jgi:hypothetical protein
MDEDYEVYTPAEAVKYLEEKRGMIFAVASLRNRRRHHQAQAHRVLSNTSLWTKTELDAIQPSSRTKRVKKSEKGDGKASDLFSRCSWKSANLNHEEEAYELIA